MMTAPSCGGEAVDVWVGGVRVVGIDRRDVNAPTLLMVHGGGQAAWVFEDWITAFAGWGWNAYALSLRGHEPQAMLPHDAYCALRLDDYRDDVLAVSRMLPGGRLVLLGHSLGGMACQLAAEQLALAGLVLVASAGPPELGTRRTLLAPDVLVQRTPDEARARYFHSAPEAVIARTLARLVPESPGALNTSGGRTPVNRALIRCPVLALSGTRDATDVPRAVDLAALYKATALELADTGHNIMQEQAGLFAASCIHAWATSHGVFLPGAASGAPLV